MNKYDVIVSVMCENVEADTPKEARIAAVEMVQHPKRTQVQKVLGMAALPFDLNPIANGRYLYEAIIKKPGLTAKEKKANERDLRRQRKARK